MMTPTVTLVTDRNGFEPMWRAELEQLELDVRAIRPEELPSALDSGSALVIDGACSVYGQDEEELLTTVGLVRAMGALPVVHLPPKSVWASDDVIEEMCGGLVARSEADPPRLASAVARRLDPGRAARFEFVTVSPRGGELLVILGDGRSMLLQRPVSSEDDKADIDSIELAEDASTATVKTVGGHHFVLRADTLAQQRDASGASSSEEFALDASRLGARLRRLRLDAGLTQAELARRTGIHRPNIARVEAGRHTPSLETLGRLASAIGIPTTRVFSDD